MFGEALRKQVEERLAFYDSGIAPMKNADAMKAALEKYGENAEEGMMDVDSDDEESEEEKPKVITYKTMLTIRRNRKRKRRIKRTRRRKRQRLLSKRQRQC